MNQLPVNEFGPHVLIGCPEGESHEIGAQAVALSLPRENVMGIILVLTFPAQTCWSSAIELSRISCCSPLQRSSPTLKHGNKSKTWRSFLPTGPSLSAAKARAIGDLFHDTKIELLASRGEDALRVFLTVSF